MVTGCHRKCPRCSYPVNNPACLRCPRCHALLVEHCQGQCHSCLLGKKQSKKKPPEI